MTRLLRALSPRSWLRRPRRTARLRLTLLYSGMFLGLGTVLIVGIALFASTGTVVHADSVAVSAVPAPAAHSPAGGVIAVPEVRAHLLKGITSGVVQQRSADVARLLGTSWVLLAVTAIASALLGWFAAGRVLRPLRQMTDTARTISAGNLGQRLALAGPDDEFKRLGDTLDDLLARLEASFDAQRRFVAN